MPSGPVAQFAFPEFTTTARMRDAARRMFPWQSTTGAALMRLVVKTPAAAQGESATIQPRSKRPLFLMPQCMPA